MKTQHLNRSLWLALAVFALGSTSAEAKNEVCSNASLRGEFGFTAHGTTFPSAAVPGPLAGAFVSNGSASYDGAGHLTLTATSSFNGLLQGPATLVGSYSMNSDCSFTSQTTNGVTFQAVLVDDGQTIFILQTTPNTVITGIARKRDAEHPERDEDSHDKFACSVASFSGTYGFVADGFAGAPTLPNAKFGPLAGVGRVTVKPDGTFVMLARRSVSGVLDPTVLPLSGSYKLSSCTAELTFDVGFHFSATIISGGEVNFIETDPGTAITVLAKRL